MSKFVYPDNPVMAALWAGALSWAYGEREIVAAFERDTGLRSTPALTGIDRMVDEACGLPAKRAEAFVTWFNANIWGEDPFAPTGTDESKDDGKDTE